MRSRATVRAALTRRVAGRAAFVACALFGASRGATAQGMPPWVPLPLGEDARSVEIVRADEPLFTAPAVKAPRRGAAALGARLPIYGARTAAGCKSEWLLVGPLAWVCGDVVRISPEPALPARVTAPAHPDGLPRAYYFVGTDGAFGYSALASAGQDRPVAELQPGYAVSIVTTGTGPGGDAFGLTTKGFWLRLSDLRPITPSLFRGYESSGVLDRGWVVNDCAAYSEPGKRISPPRTHRRLETVAILERRESGKRSYVRVGEGEWLDANDVRAPELTEPPEEARAGERWIDVDLKAQVLTAYEGKTPVFATLVSTGTGKAEEPTATPIGVHRIWVKLLTSDMDNLEDAEAEHYYAMLDVPWVAFFKNGAGLHGAFWHSSFGHVRSHGCVNLTPVDAERLFQWTSPRVPAGWTAALPTPYEPGTLVRVR